MRRSRVQVTFPAPFFYLNFTSGQERASKEGTKRESERTGGNKTMWNHSEPEDSFGEPPKSHTKGKGIAFALVPTILLLTGIGFRISRTAQKQNV